MNLITDFISLSYIFTAFFGPVAHSFVSHTKAHKGMELIPRADNPTIAGYSKDAVAKGRLWISDIDDIDDDDPIVPPDMRYVPNNIMRQNKVFLAIREAGGPIVTNDVYVRDPNSSTFWFCGKVARVSDVSLEKAASRLFPLIEEHSVRLRPLELYPKRGVLEVWCAPGDSELDVAYNRPNIRFVHINRPKFDDREIRKIKNTDVGFQGEVYQRGEEGFRTLRNAEGYAMKPEIVQKTESRAPDDEEMTRILDAVKGQDMNEFFKKQFET